MLCGLPLPYILYTGSSKESCLELPTSCPFELTKELCTFRAKFNIDLSSSPTSYNIFISRARLRPLGHDLLAPADGFCACPWFMKVLLLRRDPVKQSCRSWGEGWNWSWFVSGLWNHSSENGESVEIMSSSSWEFPYLKLALKRNPDNDAQLALTENQMVMYTKYHCTRIYSFWVCDVSYRWPRHRSME